MKIVGFIIMLAGLGLTIFTAFSYFTREKVFEIGTIDVYRDQPHSLNLNPFVGLAVMVLGAFMVLQVRKR
jgi:ABC-type uncharacterized transport system permease subunit